VSAGSFLFKFAMDVDVFHVELMSGFVPSVVIGGAMWGITSIQTISYYRNFITDPHYLRITVGVLWICNTAYLILQTSSLYDLIRISASGSSYAVPLTMFIATVIGTFVHNLVQVIYAIRIYRIWPAIYIPLICWAGSLYSFVATVIYCCFTMKKNVEEFILLKRKYDWLVYSWFSISAAVDIVITLTMCYLLRKNRDQIRKRTLRMLDKLVLWTIQTGTGTSLLALAVVVTYDAAPNPGICVGVSIVLINLCPLTLVALLNGRTLLKNADDEEFDAFDSSAPPVLSTQVVLDLSDVESVSKP